MDILMISANEYQTEQGFKTFNLKMRDFGAAGSDWVVTSWATDQPTARYFWGTKVFANLAAVEAHYKHLRGIAALIIAPAAVA